LKALVKIGRGEDDIELREMPEPVCGPGQVKIRVRAVGICGTDIHGHPSLRPPVILGHELAGDIVEVGAGCTTRKVGERVTSETTASICGKCKFCATEDYSLCIERKGIATKAEGAFTDFLVIREPSVHVLPDHVSYEAGAICELLACATHAVMEQGAVAAGEVVLVMGPGPLGLLCTQVVKACGGRTVVAGMGKDKSRLELAAKLGAERTVNVEAEDLKEVGRSMTGGYGFDAAIECAGVPPAVLAALATVRVRGRFIQAGILHKDVPVNFEDVFFVREVSMIGSHTQKPSSWRKALALLAERKVDLQALVTRELPLSQWREGFDIARRGDAIKVVLKPD
jgi:L-iditol 2-dehydrogenase